MAYTKLSFLIRTVEFEHGKRHLHLNHMARMDNDRWARFDFCSPNQQISSLMILKIQDKHSHQSTFVVFHLFQIHLHLVILHPYKFFL